MTEIILVRHGETAWNAERRLQGHLDIPLNTAGERQAALLAQVLQREPIDAVLASDLRRAIQTAQAIAHEREIHVTIDTGLRERSFGAFEGLLRSEMAANYPAEYAAMLARDVDAVYPPGKNPAETLRDFFGRVEDAMTRIATSAQGRSLVLVTHGGVLDCVYRLATGKPLSESRDFDILNAGLNRVTWDGVRFHVKTWGDVSHLADSSIDELVR